MPEHLDKNKYVPIVLISEDMKVVSITLKAILEAIYNSQKIPALFHLESTGLVHARNEAMKQLQKYFGDGMVRGFLLDSDIYFVDTMDKLAAEMKNADEKHKNFIAPYKDKMQQWNVWVANKRLDKLDGFYGKVISQAGLGFYYGDIPVSYRFHMVLNHDGDSTDGEDIIFFNENRKLKPYLANLKLAHMKVMPIV